MNIRSQGLNVASRLLVFIAVISLSWNLNGYFPFSRYNMYSKVFNRASSIFVLEDGVSANLHDYDRFVPNQDEKVSNDWPQQADYVTPSIEFLDTQEVKNYVQKHSVPKAGAGDKSIQIIQQEIRWDSASGHMLFEQKKLWSGKAHKM
jgi:hypothetical protein